MKEIVNFFEKGEYDSVEKKIYELNIIGQKKEATILKNLVLIKRNDLDRIDFEIKEIPDYIKGIYLFNKFKILNKELFRELSDTLKFYLIFYLQDPKEIKEYVDALNLPAKYKDFANGYLLFKEKKYQEASFVFRNVYSLWKEDFILEILILSYTFSKNWDSIIYFENPTKNPTINYCLGTAFYNKGMLEEARKVFSEETSGIYRKNSLFALGWINFRLERYKESINCFDTFLRENKNELEVPALYRIGRAYLRLWDMKSLNYFKEVFNRFPESDFADDAVYLTGKTYFNINITDSAKKYLYKLIVDYPDSRWYPFCVQYLGDIYFNAKDYQKAKMYYDQVVKCNLSKTNLDEINFKIEYSDYMIGKYKGELEFYKSFISKYPESSKIPELYEKIGDIYSSSKRYKDAIKYWEKIVQEYKSYQNIQEVLIKLFKAYTKIEEVEKGINLIELEIERGLKDINNLLKEIGDFYFESGDYTEAINYYNRIQDEKLKSIVYYKIGYSYYKLELLDETKVIIKSLLEDYPNSPFYDNGFLLLLQCIIKEGNEEEINELLNFKKYKISNETKIEANISAGYFFCSKRDARAIDYFTKAIVLCENDIEKASKIFFIAADCAEKLGLKEKAADLRTKGEILKK